MYTRCSKKVGKSKYFWDNFKQCFPLKKIFVIVFLNSKLLTKNCANHKATVALAMCCHRVWTNPSNISKKKY